MIQDLELKHLPFVDGAPGADQRKIEWLKNGECLNGATSSVANDGTLNRAPVSIQKNVVALDENMTDTAEKVNEVVKSVNDIKATLGAVGDASLIEVVNDTVERVDFIEKNDAIQNQAIVEISDRMDALGNMVGEHNPALDPINRNVFEELLFQKTEMGSYPNFDMNGHSQPGAPGSGMKYRIVQNSAGLHAQEIRIKQLEENWISSDVGEMATKVDEIRKELGSENLATAESVYVRLRNHNRNIATLNADIQDIKGAIMFDDEPKIGEKVAKLEGDYRAHDKAINDKGNGIIVRLNDIDGKIGDRFTDGSLEFRVWNTNERMAEIQNIVGANDSEGLRGTIAYISTRIGDDDVKDYAFGRIKSLESVQGRTEASLQDLENTVGDQSSGLIGAVVVASEAIYGNNNGNTELERNGLVKSVQKHDTEIANKVDEVPNDDFYYVRNHANWIQVGHAATTCKSINDIHVMAGVVNEYYDITLDNNTQKGEVHRLVDYVSNGFQINDKGAFRVDLRVEVEHVVDATYKVALLRNGVNVHEEDAAYFGSNNNLVFRASPLLNINDGDILTLKIAPTNAEATQATIVIDHIDVTISAI